jgi:hypothetical protein
MDRSTTSSTISTVVRLVVLSIVVGIVLSALDIRPDNILFHITRLIERVYNLGFGAIEWAIRYFLLGALIVVPIWLLSRLFSGRRRDDHRT